MNGTTKHAEVVTVRDAMLERFEARELREIQLESAAQALKPSADSRIGEIVRGGRTIYYATINGVHVECATVEDMVRTLASQVKS